MFQKWKREGGIEKVEIEEKEKGKGHFLRHHAVTKMESLTTIIRPVTDASAKDRNVNSLTTCTYRKST